MKWGNHLVVAMIVGIIVVVVWEIYTNRNLGEEVISRAAGMSIGSLVAILILVAILLWWKTSRG